MQNATAGSKWIVGDNRWNLSGFVEIHPNELNELEEEKEEKTPPFLPPFTNGELPDDVGVRSRGRVTTDPFAFREIQFFPHAPRDESRVTSMQRKLH